MSLATTPIQRPEAMHVERGTHHQRVSRLRDRERQRRLTVMGLSIIAVAMLLLVLLSVADYHYEAPLSVRLVGWVTMLTAVIGLVGYSRRWLRFESANAVGEVERAHPELGQRLRTSHDYQMNMNQVTPADPELLRALETETQQRVTARELTPIGSPWPIFLLLGICGFTIIVWTAALFVWPEWRVATARLFLMPVHYSNVQLEPIAESVHLGEDLMVRLHVEGRPLQTALVRYRGVGDSHWIETSFQPSDGVLLVDDLSGVVTDCRGNLEVQVIAGPLDSGIHPVAVRIPLVLESWTATVTPPIYTGLGSTSGLPEGLRIPAGSMLALAATYNRQPADVTVNVVPEADASSDVGIANSVANISLRALATTMDLDIRANSDDGMTDESSLHFDVIPDQRPSLKFVTPEETAEAIPTSEVHFTLQSFDDYGLSAVGIRYRIDDGPEQTLWQASANELSNAMTKTVTLALEDLNLEYPQAITYYAYAIDNREPEPQKLTGELRFIDIRPFAREYEFSAQQCSGNCQGKCLTLEKLIKQQREILGGTFAAVSQGAANDKVSSMLADEQRDLREKTQSLTEALLEKVGPMPSLTMSIRAMSNAIDGLANDLFVEAQGHEERALADLIAARQNLRKILKQSDSKAQMCRNVDQQQHDKIRKPEQEKAQNHEQELTSIREKLAQLAKKQQSFCQSAASCDKPGQSSTPSESVKKSLPSRDEFASQQRQSANEAKQIEQELRTGKFGDLAPKRVDQAAKSIAESGELITQSTDDAMAIELANEAAEQLRELSNHLARRHDPDFEEKLAAAARQAEKLADEQQQLSEKLQDQPRGGSQAEQAKQQEKLAGSGEELADLVDQLLADAANQDWQIQRALQEQTTAAPPRQATAEMQKAAESLKQDQSPSASASGSRASKILNRFAAGVKEVRNVMGPVRLAELTKAEQQAASLLKESSRANSATEHARVQALASQFAESIAPLTRDDPELAAATDQLPKLANAPTVLDDALHKVDEVLQRRIQEAILSGTLQQAVGAVPPQYTEMVEEYYRVLSGDVE